MILLADSLRFYPLEITRNYELCLNYFFSMFSIFGKKKDVEDVINKTNMNCDIEPALANLSTFFFLK